MIVQRAIAKAFELGFGAAERANRQWARGEVPFFPPEEFPWVAKVEAEHDQILHELKLALPRTTMLPNFQDVQANQAGLTQDARWKVFPFYGYGQPFKPNLERCPHTAAVLREIPGMRSAMFSILRGPKCVPAHRGPFNGVLRYHLALIVPGDPLRCRIRVGDEWRSWQEGKSLVFDDTFDHEVINENPGDRVVLFVDFLRPAPRPVAWANERIVDAIGRSPFIQAALGNLDRWNVEFEAPK